MLDPLCHCRVELTRELNHHYLCFTIHHKPFRKKDNSDTVLTMLKKLFVTLCFFSLSTEIFSETYVCSYDAKQHSETPEGGVQIVSYERKGKGFIDTANKFSFTIGYESTNNLFLVDSDQFDNGGVMSVHINKQTMEY